MPAGKRDSFLGASFDKTNAAMAFPDVTHVEASVDVEEDALIEKVGTGPFFGFVALSASNAGSLLSHDTGISRPSPVWHQSQRPSEPPLSRLQLLSSFFLSFVSSSSLAFQSAIPHG
jgi:hypothetical protein